MTTKCIIGVSKKHNSVWRVYFQDIDEYNGEQFLGTEKINSWLRWFYKLKIKKIHNNICDDCLKEFRFYKSRFDKMPNLCFECDPDKRTWSWL